MIATAHQPHWLPWLGYVNKAARADVFVWLDTVQFRKNYFQNRTRIVTADGERWLTLPVHAPHGTRIADVTIAEPGWRRRVATTLEQTYHRAPYFAACWPALHAAIDAPGERLSEVSLRVFRALLAALDLPNVTVVPASTLAVDAEEPTERLAALCAAVGADVYVSGKSGREYLSLQPFARRGVRVAWQEFDVSRTTYRRADGSVACGASVIDPLFHVGPDATRALALAGWEGP
jgi:hypothetical protein